jgi:hypothetical protein
MRRLVTLMGCLAMLVSVSACTNPYDPAQRAIGGGLIGAGAGAAIGAAAGGGHGAALGAAIGGVTGAFAGIATTPPPPGYYGYGHRRYYARHRHRHGRHTHARVSRANAANPPAN